jgi:cation diffusion facilitator CzcD-associated flavoprotein CzcO
MNSVASRTDGRPQPRICVIGAGPCGLTALKNLLAAGLSNVICYDDSDAIGGNWVFREEADRTSVYFSTHIISSKRLSEFEDYPMPTDYPDFPSHRQLRAYFDSYAAHFGLEPFIRLRTRVEGAQRGTDGRWSLSLSGGSREDFDHLVVCSGHHRDPHIPEDAGDFTGEVLHSRDFKRAEKFSDRRVLVIGGGNSACDIAVDISRVASRTCISLRHGYYIVPKLLFGRPIDLLYAKARKLPRAMVQPLLAALLRLSIGPWEKYGLAPPHCGPLEMHPTLNSDILTALRHGRVLPRAGIERFEGSTVHFRDGTAEPFDAILWATGFRISFPFLDPSTVDWDTSRPPPLYLKMMHPRFDNLFFIGLFQPIGCIWRLADHQARIAALQIAGRLPRPADIAARISTETPHWKFENTPRHALEVDYHDFRRQLMGALSRAH